MEIKGVAHLQGLDQQDHLVEQRSLVPVGKAQALVDSGGQGNSKEALLCAEELFSGED